MQEKYVRIVRMYMFEYQELYCCVVSESLHSGFQERCDRAKKGRFTVESHEHKIVPSRPTRNTKTELRTRTRRSQSPILKFGKRAILMMVVMILMMMMMVVVVMIRAESAQAPLAPMLPRGYNALSPISGGP